MITGNMLSMINRSAWVAAYAVEQTECFEIRTEASEQGKSPTCLCHIEYALGRSVADFLVADLSVWERQCDDLERCLDDIAANQNVDSGFAHIVETAQYWLAQSALFLPFVVTLMNLYPLYQSGNTLSLDACDRQMEYFKTLQPRLRELSKEFFETENQQNMRILYFNRQAKRGYGTYPILIFGRLRFCRIEKTADGHFFCATEPGNSGENGEIFAADVAETNSAQEFVDFILSCYINENLRFRTCKYCGRYFGVIGNPKIEYCDRLIEGSTKTCKETGSYRIYTKRKMEEPAVREYKRSYKAHNARIRYGLMTREQFDAWSKEAREKRDKCVAGELPFDEFVAWLDSDKM